MGLIQNKVKVSQPNSHVIVKNAGGLRGLTGEQGVPGPQGVPGEAATVTVGTTTTLPAGSDATVQNVGSTSAAIFNFAIPEGDKGDTGETGAAATVSVGATTTLEPGEDATVTNSGTSSAAVFDFGIPKGAKGDTGDTGPAGQDGADGFSPTATVSKTGDTATITITDKDGTTTAQISDGVTPTIDPALSPTSENPVQNKVVTNALADKADKPIVVSSLPATGIAGQEYFVDDRYNTVTELKGDTEQQTYTGKNKAKYEATYSANGIDSVLNSDGSLTCSGRTTTTYFNTLPYQATLPSMLPAGTYTFSRGGDTTYAVQIQLWDSTKNQTLTFRIPAGQTSITDTTTFDAYYYGSSFVYLSANMQINTTVKLQLESGSSPTSFEPYVGGTASPNPDYPQEVQTVTGEQTITVSDGQGQSQVYPINLGKNLFDKDNFPSIDGFIRADNYTLTSSASNKTTYIQVSPNTTYTFSGFALGVALVVGTFSKVPALGDVANVRVLKGASDTTVTITTGASDSYIAFMYKTSSDTLDTSAFQIEKGSATTYAPYIQAFGKNLFDIDNANTLTGCYVDNDLLIVNTGNSTISICYIKCEPNTTYTVQKENTGTNNRFALFTTAATPAAGVIALNIVGTNGAEDNHANYSITTPANAKYLGVFFAQPTGASTPTSPEIMATIQIEKGSSATTYEPNISGQLELCEIGDYQDYLYKSGEDWYVHKETQKSIFNGSENWLSSAAATGYYRAFLNMSTNNATVDGYCDEFTNRGSGPHGAYEYVWFQPAAAPVYIQLSTTRANTLETFKTWLGTHPASVYRTLATPTDTQITNSALIAQLEALAGAKIMVDGGTATVTSQYLPATLTTAYNSNSGYIDYIYDGTNFVKVR